MDFNIYQRATAYFDRSPGTPEYYALGLAGETGEVVEHVKKSLRTGLWRRPLDPEAIKLELGDVLWYLARMATRLNLSLSEIADANIAKLDERFKRVEGAPDKNCITLPDGSCVGMDCMHDPGASIIDYGSGHSESRLP